MATAPGTYQKGEVRDPLKTLLTCLVTCGFGNMYMLLKWSDDVNGGLGEQKYNGVMPPVMINDEQIAQVLTYVRNSWGNSGDIVTVDEVKKVHAESANQ